MRTRVRRPVSLVALVLSSVVLALLGHATPAAAQAATARLEIVVCDTARAPISGASIDLRSDIPRTGTTDDRGRATFARVVPARYQLTVSKTGLANETAPVTVDAGGDLRVTVVMSTSGDASGAIHAITIADVSRSISTAIAREDLERLPTTGDPWSVLRIVPSVVLDRVNVGGSESIEQPVVSANGASARDATWSLDGVPITDVGAVGLSSAHVGLSLLDQVRATTGGFDPALQTPGVHVSLQLRSGTDVARGSADVSIASRALTANNLNAATTAQLDGSRRLNRDIDGGLEFGGPLSGHTLFGWGGYSILTPNLDVFTRDASSGAFVSAIRDAAMMQSGAAKAAWVKSADTRLTFTYFGSRKARDGQDAGAPRLAATSLDQRVTSQFGSVRIDRMGSGRFQWTARYALAPSRASSDPAGGRGVVAYRDDADVWHNTYQFDADHRLQHVVAADGDYRWRGQNLRVGAELRRVSVDDLSGWPGGQFDEHVGYPILFAEAVRDRRTLGAALSFGTFAGDTWHWGRLTVDAGVRWDRQAGSVSGTSIDANPLVPSLLPALDVAGHANALVWSLVSPRAAVALALGGARRTIVRASYARSPSPLDAHLAPLLAGAPLSSVAFLSVLDKNGDQVFSPGDTASSAGVDVSNTRIGTTTTPRTDALVGEMTSEVGRVSIHAAFTFRRLMDTNWLHLDGITGANFSKAATLSGTVAPVGPFDVPVFRVNGVQVPSDLLQTFETRPGYSQQFLGFEVSAGRATATGTSWRVGLASGRTQEHFDSVNARYDPTPSAPGTDVFALASANVDAGDVARPSIDSNGNTIFVVTPRYQVFATATLALPWHLSATPVFVMRQGFAAPYFTSAATGSADASSPDGKNVLLTPAIDTFRLAAVQEVDVRVTRPLRLAGRSLHVDVDVFNVLNRATPLARAFDTRDASFNRVLEVQSPLTLRIGVRVPIR